ncbi:hypothetical protein ACWC2K_07810 [Streptomyces chattanoogensis]
MRKITAIALAAAAGSASLTLSTASDAAAAERPPQCVKVRKHLVKGHYRYVKLTNLCSKRKACYTIVIPHAKDPSGALRKGETKYVRYGTTSVPRALFVRNDTC